MCSLISPLISRPSTLLLFQCHTQSPHSQPIPWPPLPSAVCALHEASHLHPPCLGLMSHLFPSLSVRSVLSSASPSSLSSMGSVCYPPNPCSFIFLPMPRSSLPSLAPVTVFQPQPRLTFASCPPSPPSALRLFYTNQFSQLCNKDRFRCSAKKMVDIMPDTKALSPANFKAWSVWAFLNCFSMV